MTGAADVAVAQVPGYLGRVLYEYGVPAATCFQVAPGVLVTAWHVLNDIDAAAEGTRVQVDPLAGGEAFGATVACLDPARDLAVLTSAGELSAVAGPLTATDQVQRLATVTVTGYAVVDDPGHVYGFLDAPGKWAGRTTRDKVPLGRMTSKAVLPGMSGAPVILDSDGAVAGVVSGRYNSTDGWLAGTVWVARTEDLAVLLNPIAKVTIQDARAARPAGSVRVSEADLRRLGVHAAISVPGLPDEVLPEYVLRDVDTAEHGVRAKVAAAAERGGFVLLVGGSSVGKTRTAAEAVMALLPDWRLVHPADPAEVTALAQASPPKTVVWLDELQRYLDGEHALTGGVVRTLLDAPHPAVIIGTLWPGWYNAYTIVPAPGAPDPYAREREVLDLAAVIRIASEFSAGEQDRARAAAAGDPRLRVALCAAGYGLTQTLAAAPQLVARWEDAQTVDPYAWAVLTAALDVARLGARAPLSTDLLRAAAPGYLTSQQQAEAPENWFDQAMTYATAKLHGAAAPLGPAAAGIGRVAGYTPADYLLQHANLERRYTRVPASTWDTVLSYIRDPANAVRIADSAKNRLLYRYAIPLYRRATDAGNRDAVPGLANLLAKRGNLKEATQILRARDKTGDEAAALILANLLAEQGDLEEAIHILQPRADAGDKVAAVLLIPLLVKSGDRDGAARVLAAMAHIGDWAAGRGNLDELRARLDADGGFAAWQRATELAEHGHLKKAIKILRARADGGDQAAAWRLADLLAEQGDLEGLRARADVDHLYAAVRLADLLAEQGDLEGLRARADVDHLYAAVRLADLLAEQGDLEGLRARADAGDQAAASKLADLLAERGDLEALRARADAGDEYVGGPLTDLLTKQGRGEEAEQLRRFGLNPDGSIACP